MAVQEVIPVRYRAFGADLVARYLVSFFYVNVIRTTALWLAFVLLAPQLGFTWIGLYVAVFAIRSILTKFDPDGQKFKVHAKDVWRIEKANEKKAVRREKRELKAIARHRRRVQRLLARRRNEAGVV